MILVNGISFESIPKIKIFNWPWATLEDLIFYVLIQNNIKIKLAQQLINTSNQQILQLS